VEKESKINEKTSSIESQIKEEIKSAVEKEKITAAKKHESLKWELESVRQDIARIEQQHALREDMLRKEISDLQQVKPPIRSIWAMSFFFLIQIL
jgi:hypothetical protein